MPIESFPESGWDKVMDLNVKAPFFLIQALLGALCAGAASRERPAKIINIASIDGLSVNMQADLFLRGVESRPDSLDASGSRSSSRRRTSSCQRDRAREPSPRT